MRKEEKKKFTDAELREIHSRGESVPGEKPEPKEPEKPETKEPEKPESPEGK